MKNANAGMVTDPVCGMQVDPATSKYVLEHEGARVAFCSAGCLAKFKADPKKYQDNPAAKPAACCGGHAHAHEQAPAASTVVATPGARYTCPMHPEILQDGPGDCPKCGMALVPIGGTAAADDTELHDLKRGLWIGAVLS